MIRLVLRWLSKVVLVGTVIMMVSGWVLAAEDNKACRLIPWSDIESVVGSTVTLNTGLSKLGENTELCSGQTPNAKVLLRVVSGLDPGRDRSGTKEKAGLEMMKKMGVQVEVKTVGPIVCSTLVPPTGKEQMGYNTTCTVRKDTAMAGIEITVHTKSEMVPIDKLFPLAEKMSGRF